MTLVRNHGVTAPAGFKASAVGGSVAVLINEGPDLKAAGVFGGREQPTAALLWTKQVLGAGKLRAVLLHAGATDTSADLSGEFGETHRAAERLAESLSDWGTSTGAAEVAVCTTGGDREPVEPLLAAVSEAIYELAGGMSGGAEAAKAVAGHHDDLTRERSDAVQAAVQHDGGWTVGGMGAGDGAVCVLTTDALVDSPVLLTVVNSLESGSTTVLLLASGASEITCAPDELASAVAAVRADLRAQEAAA